MHIDCPQAIYLALTFLGLGLRLAQDGQPKKGSESFSRSLLGCVLVMSLLWWGGFF